MVVQQNMYHLLSVLRVSQELVLISLVRHRIASYSQQSQRYVDGTSIEFVTPPEIKSCPEAYEEYKKVIDLQSDAYSKIRDALVVKYIKEFKGEELSGTNDEIINSFKEENKRQCNAFIKKANEDARFVLPMLVLQRLFVLSMLVHFTTSLLTVVVTELSGKLEK